MSEPANFDFIIIGGGLAGILAGFRLAQHHQRVALIDKSLPGAAGRLGGFLKFSGAKFSLLPAGQGLIEVAGSIEYLNTVTSDVLKFLGLDERAPTRSAEVGPSQCIGPMELRSYESIVLTPHEIDALLDKIEGEARERVVIIDSSVEAINRNDALWQALGEKGRVIAAAPVAIYAGGRMGGHLLRDAGAEPQEGKGIDLGVRVEFVDKTALHQLRRLGPDAKMLYNRSRTFCLNSPGEVYRYRFGDISIPGGVVADANAASANVGLLHRAGPKMELLSKVRKRLSRLERSDYEAADIISGEAFGDKFELMADAFGCEIAAGLLEFADLLGQAGLVDWNAPHRVHFPLLDWHWDTYAVGHTHHATMKNLFVIGDSAGHARGLLQAAVSGWLVADEARAT